jgi:acetyl-CoA C-acetyltransferase
MVERLRGAERKGLVSAMGWYATKHSVGIYSGVAPPASGGEWRRLDSPADQAGLDAAAHPMLVEAPEGRGTVEGDSVGFDRSGEPEAAIVVGRLEEGVASSLTRHDRDMLSG